jgi:hypothetical protein
MDPEVLYYLKERQEKQVYLKDEIQLKGYDVASFAQFLEFKRGMLLL